MQALSRKRKADFVADGVGMTRLSWRTGLADVGHYGILPA